MASPFSIIPNWLIRDTSLSGNELLVYIALLNRANQYGIAWPSVATLAKEARISESSVHRTLKQLEQRGLVSRKRRKTPDGSNQSNMYHVTLFRDPPLNAPWYHGDTRGVSRRQLRGVTVTEEEEPYEEEPYEADIRSVLEDEREGDMFFTPLSTQKQQETLSDLYIHANGQAPNETVRWQWSMMTIGDAQQAIQRFYSNVGRYDEYIGPEQGDPAYEQLSDTGKKWADALMLPGDVK